MRKLAAQCLVAVALVVMAVPAQAQTDLTDSRTVEQKFARIQFGAAFIFAGLVSQGEAMGHTPEQIGRSFGEFGARSWGGPGSETLSSFVRQTFLNHNVWPNAEFEILSESESEIRFRTNHPWATFFGESGVMYGVSLADFSEAWAVSNDVTANSLGFDMVHEMEGDWIAFTVKTR